MSKTIDVLMFLMIFSGLYLFSLIRPDPTTATIAAAFVIVMGILAYFMYDKLSKKVKEIKVKKEIERFEEMRKPGKGWIKVQRPGQPSYWVHEEKIEL